MWFFSGGAIVRSIPGMSCSSEQDIHTGVEVTGSAIRLRLAQPLISPMCGLNSGFTLSGFEGAGPEISCTEGVTVPPPGTFCEDPAQGAVVLVRRAVERRVLLLVIL